MARTYGKAQDLIDFTRASSGTALRRVKYGAELVTNGTFDTDSDWAKGAGWTISGGELVATSVSAFVSAYQTVSLTAGKIYKVTYDITSFTAGAVRFKLTSGTEVSGANNASVGTFTDILIPNSGNDTLSIQAAGSGFTGTIDNVSVKEVIFDTSDGDLVLFNHPNNIPRIEYDANGNLLGLLVEESRTNTIAYSNFDSGWGETTFSGISSSGLRYLQLNAGTAPDGTNTAVKVYASTNSDQQRLYYSVGLANAQYTFSFYAKAAEYTTIAIRHDTGNGESIVVDLTDGSLIGTTTPEAYSITDVGNGWYRISITDTDTDASGVPWVQLLNDLGAESFAGDGVSGVYIWGPQAEAGAFPTSYIPTSGSTATRSADVASLSTSAFGENEEAGTFVVEFDSTYETGGTGYPRVFEYGATGTATQRINIFNGEASDDLSFGMYTDNVAQANGVLIANNGGYVSAKAGFSYKKNLVYAVANGSVIITDTSADIIPSQDRNLIKIGGSVTAGDQVNGHIKSLKYYPRALTADQIEALTA